MRGRAVHNAAVHEHDEEHEEQVRHNLQDEPDEHNTRSKPSRTWRRTTLQATAIALYHRICLVTPPSEGEARIGNLT